MLRYLLVVATLAACGTDDDGPPIEFPADYLASYTEVRDCRKSADHDLRNIRILADPAALSTYQNRDAPFAEGAIVLKEEYDFADDACAGPLVEWTVMRRIAGTEDLGWHWQRVAPDRSVVTDNDGLCSRCHAGCGKPPDGFDGTCAVP
jgi:hypothetical protein